MMNTLGSVARKWSTPPVRPAAGLTSEVCECSTRALKKILDGTLALLDLYREHHARTESFQLHELYGKHYAEQSSLADMLAGRIQFLAGAGARAATGPGREDLANSGRLLLNEERDSSLQITRLVEGHEWILRLGSEAAAEAKDNGDDGTSDLLVRNLIRVNELHVWFLAQHMWRLLNPAPRISKQPGHSE